MSKQNFMSLATIEFKLPELNMHTTKQVAINSSSTVFSWHVVDKKQSFSIINSQIFAFKTMKH